MRCYRRKAKNVLNPETEIDYTIRSSYKGTKFPHCHDFYELFFIIKGRQLLTVNKRVVLLQESSLALVRPKDVHSKEFIDEGLHINVAFAKRTANELFHYLGKGFPKEMLLNSEIPPFVVLNSIEKRIVQESMESLSSVDVSETQTIKTRLRILLFQLLTQYFTNINYTKRNIPPWMSTVLVEMDKKENFTSGLSALIKFSGMTHSYLCRSFKKHLNFTPTELINDQRLNYAANLLIRSDLEIVDICLDSGFGNLSHFYHVFKQKFNATPLEYRKLHSASGE